MTTLKIKCALVLPGAKVPEYKTEGAIAFDLCAVLDAPVFLDPGESVVVHTGLAFEVPVGYGLFVVGRSGHGFKHDVRLANCLALIDSDYRGEVLLKVTRDPSSSGAFQIKHGQAIAQAFVLQRPTVVFETVSYWDLSVTARANQGFGSTGG